MRNMFKRKQYLAPMIFNAIEYYDSSLYGFMSPILIAVFLPNIDPVNAIIITLLAYPIGILSKPLGAYFIGSMGDKYGRKKALAFAISGMGVATGMISILPSYESIGLLAPILFALLRMMQMFFMAGEYNGGAIFALEHAKSNNRSFISSLYCAITVVGVTLAATASTIVIHYGKEYWRVPYFISFFTSFVALYIRLKMSESPEFLKNKKSFKFDLFKCKKQVFIAISVACFFSVLYTTSSVFILNFVPLVTDFSKATINIINTYSLILYMVMLPVFGYLSDKIGYKKVMFFGVVAAILFSGYFMDMIYSKALYMIIGMKMIFSIIKSAFVAPFHAFMQDMFEVKKRYSMISISYAIGGQIGAFAPAIYMYYWQIGKMVYIVPSILLVTGVLAIIAIYFHSKSSDSYKS